MLPATGPSFIAGLQAHALDCQGFYCRHVLQHQSVL